MRQVGALELQEWMADAARESPGLLDVREPWEVALCVIEGSVAIPMSAIPARLDEIDRSRTWVVVCHHGMRSQQVASWLQHQGFAQMCNLQGGIDGWARDVDPGMRQY